MKKIDKVELWSALVEELIASEPRLAVIRARMKQVGLVPGNDLVDCMERAWSALEPRFKKLEVSNEF